MTPGPSILFLPWLIIALACPTLPWQELVADGLLRLVVWEDMYSYESRKHMQDRAEAYAHQVRLCTGLPLTHPT